MKNCGNSMPKKKKGIVISVIVLVALVLVATLIGFYMMNNDKLWFQQESVSAKVKKEDIQTKKGSKVYKVNANSKITEEDMNYIVSYLKMRAEYYTTQPVVLMKECDSNWYVEISIPEMNDAAYEKVIRNVDLKFVGGYDSDHPEVIVTNKNIESASASTIETTTGVNNYVVNLVLDEAGTKAFAEGTEKYIGSPLSIVLDGKVISAPIIDYAITGGKAQINAQTYEEAERLATLLRVGYLGFELEEIK